MFAVKYAFTNATRLWRETVPLFVLTALIMFAITVSATLSAYSSQVFDEILAKYEIAVSLFYSPVLSQTANIISKPPKITYDIVSNIAEDPAVNMACFQYAYTFETPWLWQVNFNNTEDKDIVVTGSGLNQIVFIGITNAAYSDIPPIFAGRGIKDIDGIDINQRVVMISQYISEEKGLHVGDTIQIAFPKQTSTYTNTLFEEPFEVIGIFKNYANLEQNLNVYIPFSLIKNGYGIDADQEIHGKIRFILNSPDETAGFIRRSLEKFGELPLAMEANDYDYKREIYPSSTAHELNQIIVVISAVTGGLLIILINILLIRVRKRELIMLWLIGCPRKQVLLSYVFEKIFIAFIGIIFGGLLGLVLLTNGLLGKQAIPFSVIDELDFLINTLFILSPIIICSVLAALPIVYGDSREVE